MTREQAIEVCGKLLALAARGGTVGEAAAAAAKAEEILTRYELTADLVNGVGAGSVEEAVASFYQQPEGWLDDMPTRIVRWRWVLASRLTRLHGCFCFLGRRGSGVTIEIIGRPSDVDTVRYFYAWLTREIEHLTKLHGRGMGLVWRNNFSHGTVDGIITRLQEQREATAKTVKEEYRDNPHALVLVSQSLERIATHAVEAREFGYKLYRLRSFGRGGAGQQFNPTARDAGRTASQTINLGNSGTLPGRPARQIGGRS